MLLDMASELVAEGYSLRDTLDYDEGLPQEEIYTLFKRAQRARVKRRKTEVEDRATAMASLFDKNVMRQFGHAVMAAINQLTDRTPEEQREHALRELGKLGGMLGVQSGERPPWEKQ